MTTAVDLMAFGMGGELSRRLGQTPTTLVTTGTTQATAALVLSRLVTLTTAGSQTGAIVQAASAIGTEYIFSNPTATSAIVYAPVGHTLNGGASTTGLTLAQNKCCRLIQMSKGVWVTILTA